MTDIKIPEPHNEDAELAVLGGVLIMPDYVGKLRFLEPDRFFLMRHAWIWETIKELHKKREPIDYLTVVNRLEAKNKLAEVGGAAYILKLIHQTPNALNITGYANIVDEYALRRDLLRVSEDIARLAHSKDTSIEEVCDKAKARVTEVTRRRSQPMLLTAKQVSEQAQERQLRIMSEGESLALPTGFPELDRLTDGQLQYGRYVGILAESGMGKSTLAGQLALEWAKLGPVVFFSQEMTPVNVLDRMACALANVPLTPALKGKINKQQLYALNVARQAIGRLPLYIVGRRLSVSQMSDIVATVADEHGVEGVAIVDTVNKVKGVRSSLGSREGMTRTSEQLEEMKTEHGWLVVGLFQHRVDRTLGNSPMAKDVRPNRESLKESGDPLNDMDVLFSIYRSDPYRRKYGTWSAEKNAYVGWDDPMCPPGEAISEILKLRDGNPDQAPARFKWMGGIPAFRALDWTPAQAAGALKIASD